MVIEEATRSDDLFEIEVSDLRPAGRARQWRPAPDARISTRQRARRYVASLLAMALLGLSLAPGARASLPGTPLVTAASAHQAPQPDQADLRDDSLLLWRRAPRLVDTVERAPYSVTRGHTMTLR